MFIELTPLEGQEKRFIFRAEAIDLIAVQERKDGKLYTVVTVGSQHTFTVQETPEEILEMINQVPENP